MKNKFERLSKIEQKAAIQEFTLASANNKYLIKRLTRLRVIGIIGIIYALLMFVMDFLKEKNIFDYGLNVFDNILISYILDACLLIFCVIFYLKGRNMVKEVINNYLIQKNKK